MFESIEAQVIILLSLASLVAVLARRLRIPYTIAMLLTGVALSLFVLSFLGQEPGISLTRHLILVIFLPGLLFEAAFHLNLKELRDNVKTVATLAVPGILLAAGISALIVTGLTELTFGAALLFGVLISATDPIAVLAIFKELGTPKRLSIIVEGESLFNDGTAVVLFEIVLAVVLGHQVFSVTDSIAQFFIVVAGGGVLGLITGFLFTQMMRHTNDPMVDMALTMVLAYGTFLLGEELHVSPVIAVVVAGIVMGNFASQRGFSASSRLTVTSFWAYIGFLINSAIFLLIGLDVHVGLLLANAGPVLVGIFAMLVARLLVIYPLGFIANRVSYRGLSIKWVHVLFWGGLRGSVSLALALSLPIELPQRDLIELMAYGAVFFSVVGQGLTIQPLLKALNMTRKDEIYEEYERRRARWTIMHTSLHAVDDLHDRNMYPGQVRDRLKRRFETMTQEAWESLTELTTKNPQLLQADVEAVQRALADEQKVALEDMLRLGTISEETYYELNTEINKRIAAIYTSAADRQTDLRDELTAGDLAND